MLGSLFNKAADLMACERRPQHGCFPVYYSNFESTYFEEHLHRTVSIFLNFDISLG